MIQSAINSVCTDLASRILPYVLNREPVETCEERNAHFLKTWGVPLFDDLSDDDEESDDDDDYGYGCMCKKEQCAADRRANVSCKEYKCMRWLPEYHIH